LIIDIDIGTSYVPILEMSALFIYLFK